MNLFHPDRPRIGGVPALVAHGKPLCAMPRIQVQIQEDCYLCSVMLPVAFNEYSYHHADSNKLDWILQSLIDDPECAFRDLFSWSYSETPAKPSTFDPDSFLKGLGL